MTDFKSLLQKIDDDFDAIQKSAHPRKRVYYDIKIDGNDTNIIARSMLMPLSHRPRMSFLIQNFAEETSYSSIFLSELDIIEILSLMDSDLYDHLMEFFVKLYRNEIDRNQSSVEFLRDAMISEIDAVSLDASEGIALIPTPKEDTLIKTHIGHTLSFKTFCQCLSLILSTENIDKLKIVLAKYYLTSSLARSGTTPVRLKGKLIAARRIDDIREVYKAQPYTTRQFTRMQEHDAKVFNAPAVAEYFKTA